MGVDEKGREQAILDAAASLLLRHGYNKTTMSDVADAVGLNRALVYLHFKSKDALVEALVVRELKRYGEEWSNYLDTDPLGGTVASLYRSTLHVLKGNSLRAAIHTRDEQTFGKYLRKPGNIFTRLPNANYLTRDFLLIMQEAGVVRKRVNIDAMAFIMDALTPALLETLSSHVAEARGEPRPSNRPSDDELLETIAEMLERMLTPAEGANLEAGKVALHQGLEQMQARFWANMKQQRTQPEEGEEA
jgi:AcrR family transcriptional regulator